MLRPSAAPTATQLRVVLTLHVLLLQPLCKAKCDCTFANPGFANNCNGGKTLVDDPAKARPEQNPRPALCGAHS